MISMAIELNVRAAAAVAVEEMSGGCAGRAMGICRPIFTFMFMFMLSYEAK